MDHHQHHHQQHDKQREERIKHNKEHERASEKLPRTIHPLWFLVVGVVLIGGVLLTWFLAVR